MNSKNKFKYACIIIAFLLVIIFQFYILKKFFLSPDDFLNYIAYSKQILTSKSVSFFEPYWQLDFTLYRWIPNFFVLSAEVNLFTGIDLIYVVLVLGFIEQFLLILSIFFLYKKNIIKSNWIIYLILIILFLGLSVNRTGLDPSEIFSRIWYPLTSIMALTLGIFAIRFGMFEDKKILYLILLASGFLFNPPMIGYLLIPIFIFSFIGKFNNKKSYIFYIISIIIFIGIFFLFLFLSNPDFRYKILANSGTIINGQAKAIYSFSDITKISNSIPYLYITFFFLGLFELIKSNKKGEFNFIKAIIGTLIISFILGYIILIGLVGDFRYIIYWFILISTPILAFVFLKSNKKFIQIIIVSLLVILLVTSQYGTLYNLNKESSNNWLLTWEYTYFIYNLKDHLDLTKKHIADPVTNRIFSDLTLMNSSYYSPRSTVVDTCEKLKAGNVNSPNRDISIELGNFFNERDINTTILKNFNINYIIDDKIFMKEVCNIDSYNFDNYIYNLTINNKIRLISCNKDKRICVYNIN